MPYFPESSEELRDLNRQEKRIISLTVLGAFFICFDFIIYFFFNDAISRAFFPETMPENVRSAVFLLILLLGYISRPLGAILMADYGDRRGRKPVMIFSLLIVSIATILIALLPTYQQFGIWSLILLMVLRFMQGVGIGAEVTTSWVYLSEHVPRRHIGSACGMLIGAFILSALCCNVFNLALLSMLTPSQSQAFGWRLPFLIGGLGTLIAIVLRYQLSETPIWLDAKNKQKLLTKLPLKTALKKYHYGLLMTFALSWFTSSVYLVAFLMMPSIGENYFDIDHTLMSFAHCVGLFFGVIGSIIFGYLVDRFNPGRVFSICCFLLAISGMMFFFTLRQSSELILLTYAIFGFFCGIIGIVPSVCVRLFPVFVRLSGVAFSYNVAYAITGGLTPFLINYFSKQLTSTSILYVVFLCVFGIILGLLLTNLHGLYRMESNEMMDKSTVS